MSKYDQTTCTCNVYKFPHRFNSGKCVGINIVENHWLNYYGYDNTCHDCNCFVSSLESNQCEIIEGREQVHQCPVWQEFVLDTGARIKPIWRKYL